MSSGAFGQADWMVEVELVESDGELLITRVVGPVGFVTVILFVWLPGSEWREVLPFIHKSSSLISPRLFREAKWDHNPPPLLLLSSSYTIFTLFVLEA